LEFRCSESSVASVLLVLCLSGCQSATRPLGRWLRIISSSSAALLWSFILYKAHTSLGNHISSHSITCYW